MTGPPGPTEPWLRGTHSDVAAVPRAAIHAFEQAAEDMDAWCAELTDAELSATPYGLPSIAFQLRHIAASLDRLLTYAEGRALNEQQLAALQSEGGREVSADALFEQFAAALKLSSERVRELGPSAAALQEPRAVGRKNLPTTVAGLLVHVAEHTQRHVGQAITTAKILLAQRDE
jgi:uncharacterized damage-inducible protein DinB